MSTKINKKYIIGDIGHRKTGKRGRYASPELRLSADLPAIVLTKAEASAKVEASSIRFLLTLGTLAHFRRRVAACTNFFQSTNHQFTIILIS